MAEYNARVEAGRLRDDDHQRMQVASRYGIHNKKLVQVIGEMEQHSEPPLSTSQLALGINVTRRQLERLFRLHLNDTPRNFYLGPVTAGKIGR